MFDCVRILALMALTLGAMLYSKANVVKVHGKHEEVSIVKRK